LRPVIGERGRWLSRFNPAWRWAADGSAAGDGVADDAETVWNEGTPAQRLEVLRRVK
jgi:hypothetical protein